jgi:hypothetical protein
MMRNFEHFVIENSKMYTKNLKNDFLGNQKIIIMYICYAR